MSSRAESSPRPVGARAWRSDRSQGVGRTTEDESRGGIAPLTGFDDDRNGFGVACGSVDWNKFATCTTPRPTGGDAKEREAPEANAKRDGSDAPSSTEATTGCAVSSVNGATAGRLPWVTIGPSWGLPVAAERGRSVGTGVKVPRGRTRDRRRSRSPRSARSTRSNRSSRSTRSARLTPSPGLPTSPSRSSSIEDSRVERRSLDAVLGRFDRKRALGIEAVAPADNDGSEAVADGDEGALRNDGEGWNGCAPCTRRPLLSGSSAHGLSRFIAP